MLLAPDWKDYEVIATGDGEKLERWGDLILLRPDPQVIWHAKKPLRSYPDITAIYERSSTGGGFWKYNKPGPDDFVIGWRDLQFKLKLMGFKHTGLFPEQAVNWARMMKLIEGAGREISVLNLFGILAQHLWLVSRRGQKFATLTAQRLWLKEQGTISDCLVLKKA